MSYRLIIGACSFSNCLLIMLRGKPGEWSFKNKYDAVVVCKFVFLFVRHGHGGWYAA